MPQRQFWATAHPTEVRLAFCLPHLKPELNPTVSMSILDQSGRILEWNGGFVPAGFAAWAFSDAVRAGMEAFELSTPQDAIKAFQVVRTEWLGSARHITKLKP